jgi:hypothetical protein
MYNPDTAYLNQGNSLVSFDYSLDPGHLDQVALVGTVADANNSSIPNYDEQ